MVKFKNNRKSTKKIPKAIKAYVKKEISQEVSRKQFWLAHAASSTSINTTGVRYLINAATAGGQLDRGDTYLSREGDEIKIHSLHIRVCCNVNTNVPIASRARCVILYDKQPDGTVFTGTELMNSQGTGEGVVSSFRYDMRHKFRILYDHTMPVVSQYVNTAAGGTNVEFQYTKSFKNPLKTTYYATGTTGLIADISIGAIYVVVYADNSNIQVFNTFGAGTFSDG